MGNVGPGEGAAQAVDLRALAVAILDISADVKRKSHQETGVRPLPWS
ncbi:hypothetical protein [Arthrobacter oryzae]|nr:hypothetical protein [Arthrobacter oryzae]WLQ07678.1 hypothetical protein Q8Z05_05890 [Arthrobacter oryzae]